MAQPQQIEQTQCGQYIWSPCAHCMGVGGSWVWEVAAAAEEMMERLGAAAGSNAIAAVGEGSLGSSLAEAGDDEELQLTPARRRRPGAQVVPELVDSFELSAARERKAVSRADSFPSRAAGERSPLRQARRAPISGPQRPANAGCGLLTAQPIPPIARPTRRVLRPRGPEPDGRMQDKRLYSLDSPSAPAWERMGFGFLRFAQLAVEKWRIRPDASIDRARRGTECRLFNS